MIAFLEFKKANCDYVILECGIGGTYDSTNIIETPELIACAIASIGWDHMEILGENLEEIAGNKAGIIKKGVPCVIGPSCYEGGIKSIV